MLFDTRAFEREIHVYAGLLEQMRRVQKEQGCAKILEPNWPKCYHTCIHPQTKVAAIVMEDLSVSGYRLMNVAEGLDHAHLLCALKSLARSHAISFNLKCAVGIERLLLDNVPLLDEPMCTFEESINLMLQWAVAIIRYDHRCNQRKKECDME